MSLASVDKSPGLGLGRSSSSSDDARTISFPAGMQVRAASRAKRLTEQTSGLAPTHLQANLLVLPSRYADDFRLLCSRNPVPCPLIAETPKGDATSLLSKVPGLTGPKLAGDVDIRYDIPRYNVFEGSKLVKTGCLDIAEEWKSDDHVGFVIGCSHSFETALTEAGLPPRHNLLGRAVAAYRTTIPLNSAGVFSSGTYVVSMRPYKAVDIPRVRAITRAYNATHGEPIAWGWDAVQRLGIKDIDAVDWCDAPLTLDGRPLSQVWGSEDDVPVFWGCGVTPQEAVARADLEGVIMSHAAGHMLVLDAKDSDITG